MKKLIAVCAVLVLVQTGLVVLTNYYNPSQSQPDKGPLLKIAAAEINELILEDAEGQSLLLKKDKEQWQLPALDSFPADTVRVRELIERLAGLQRGWPEATTAEAATRFKVAADRFERKLTVRKEGDAPAVLYFGSSPGLRKIYFRVDGDSEIHALALGQHDLEARADAWIDTRVLHLKPEHVLRVDLPGVQLVRQGEGLQPADLTANEEIVKDGRDALVKRLTTLAITSVLGKESKPEYGLDAPALRYTLELEGGGTIEYIFGQPPKTEAKEPGEQAAEPESYVVKVSNRDQLFRVEGWQVDAIRKANRATLVRSKEPAPAVQSPIAPAAPTVQPQ